MTFYRSSLILRTRRPHHLISVYERVESPRLSLQEEETTSNTLQLPNVPTTHVQRLASLWKPQTGACPALLTLGFAQDDRRFGALTAAGERKQAFAECPFDATRRGRLADRGCFAERGRLGGATASNTRRATDRTCPYFLVFG